MDRISEVLAEQGRSKTWLAKQLDVSRTWLYRLMNEQEPWTWQQRAAVSLALGVPEKDLFVEADDATE